MAKKRRSCCCNVIVLKEVVLKRHERHVYGGLIEGQKVVMSLENDGSNAEF